MAVKSFIVPINVKMSLRQALRLCLNHPRSAWSRSIWESERGAHGRDPTLRSAQARWGTRCSLAGGLTAGLTV